MLTNFSERHPQWPQSDVEPDEDMQSQCGEADGYTSAETCGEEISESGRPYGEAVESGRPYGDLDEEGAGADCGSVEREVEEAGDDPQHRRKHPEADDQENDATATTVNVRPDDAGERDPDKESNKTAELESVPPQEKPNKPVTAKAQDARAASPTKRRRQKEDIQVAKSSRPQNPRGDDFEEPSRSPKKRKRPSGGSLNGVLNVELLEGNRFAPISLQC